MGKLLLALYYRSIISQLLTEILRRLKEALRHPCTIAVSRPSST